MKTPDKQTDKKQNVLDQVREGYANIARGSEGSCCGPAPSSCCGASNATDAEQLAAAIGYGKSDLEGLPEGANLGLSCGNPVALASLKPGDVVLDLGSGGGFDAFIAGRKVGPTGRVIGVDMTPEMIGRARRNVASYCEATGLDNVEFRLGEIEHLPVADGSIDVVLSNCVINLSPDKPQVWSEIVRVLKPGGRVSVSDIVLKKPLPPELASDIQALVGCIAGAMLFEDLKRTLREVGLVDLQFKEETAYIEAMVQSRDPLALRILSALPEGESPADLATSMNINARKPSPRTSCCPSSGCC